MYKCPRDINHQYFKIRGSVVHNVSFLYDRRQSEIDVNWEEETSRETIDDAEVICNDCDSVARLVPNYPAPEEHPPLSREWREAARGNTVNKRDRVSN